MKKNNLSFLYQNFWLLLTIFISLLPLFPLLHPGIFSGHDSPDHVARIANFYQNLKEGNLIPRWAGNLNWGYGHPILMFLYPLSSYVASLFMFLGVPVVSATKIVFALGFVLSGITMFVWIRKVWGEQAGFIAAVFYLFAPYRFVDLYVRGAIGENFFFIFPPLSCYFLVKLFETKKLRYVSLTALALSGMLLSHNALTIMFLPFVAMYGLVMLINEKNKIKLIIYSLLSLILSFGISAFFIVPAFLEGKYTLRDIVIKNEIFNRFETFLRILYSPWSHGGTGSLSVQVGILHWIVVVAAFITIIYLFNKKSNQKINNLRSSLLLGLLALVFFVLSLFLMLPISKKVYEVITTLQKFQFPWRFLSLSVFTSAVLAGFLAGFFRSKKIGPMVVVGIVVVLVSIPFWQPDGFIEKDDPYYTTVYESTTDTGESAPIWSVRFMEKRPQAPAQIVEGEGTIEMGTRTSVRHAYTINIISPNTRILENTLYFPGWKVNVDGRELAVSDLLFQDPNYRGLINFYINSPGVHEVVVQFTETKLRYVSNIISMFSIIVVVGLLIYGKK